MRRESGAKNMIKKNGTKKKMVMKGRNEHVIAGREKKERKRNKRSRKKEREKLNKEMVTEITREKNIKKEQILTR